MQQLIPKRHIYNLLGCLCKKPKMILDENYIFNTEDFGEQFYQLIFGVINNSIINNPNLKEISAVDIDNMLAESVQGYKIYESNDGFNFISTAIETANLDLFGENYASLKKYSLLRDCVEQGLDIKEVYDYESTDLSKQARQLDALKSMSIGDIVDRCIAKVINIQNKWSLSENKKTYTADHEIDTLIERLQRKEEMGYPYANGFYNSVFNGMKFKKLVIRSAGTGVGKTRLALADLVQVAAVERYDIETNQWIKNTNPLPTSLISTELEIQELQTCMIAIISNVNESIVKSGNYSPDVLSRITKAIEVIKKSNINLHYIDDFSISDIELIIKKDILEKNVRYVWFDYIQITPKLSRTIQAEFGMNLREDQILLLFSSRLKILANKYSIYLSSSTQTNRAAKDDNNKDTSGLRGGSALADKCDIGIMCFKAGEKEHDKLKHILEGGIYEKPNFSHWVFKHRGGRSGIVIWTNLNYGTMHEKVAFITDNDYNLLSEFQPVRMVFDNANDVENNPFS